MIAGLHRKLALRLTIGAVVIASLFGTGVYYYEMEQIDESIVDSVAAEAKAFAREAEKHAPLSTAKDDPDLEKDLADLLLRNRNPQDGSFIIAEVYDPHREKIAEAVPPSVENVEAMLKQVKHRFPKQDASHYEKMKLNGNVYIQALTPLRGADGEMLGYFEGVYEVSEERLAEIADLIKTSLAMVVMAVLATAILLYPVIRSLNNGLISLSRDLLIANAQTLEVLGGAIAKRDSDTHTHNFRVTIYAVRLAEAVGMPPLDIRELIKGSFLHDVGKIAISDRILLKPGKLDDEEYEIMKTHVDHGIDIVRHSGWLAEAAKIVGAHHEKFDGSGYPKGLAGEEIPLGARIFAIADVFDALTSPRPYKPAFSLEKTLSILDEGSGTHFDPTLLGVFREIAPALHAAFGGKEDPSVEETARTLSLPYFEL